jgi:hypothetical protein
MKGRPQTAKARIESEERIARLANPRPVKEQEQKKDVNKLTLMQQQHLGERLATQQKHQPPAMQVLSHIRYEQRQPFPQTETPMIASKALLQKRPQTATARSPIARQQTATARSPIARLEYQQETQATALSPIAIPYQQEYKPFQQEPHQQPNLGIYNFPEDTTVYCFSDIESNMPQEIKDLMFHTNDKKPDIEYTPIDLKKERKAIVFTGDLIDRGAYTVRNLLNMLNLKVKNNDNVILICGNRDINKIRMYHECCIEEIDEKILKKGSELTTIESIIGRLKQIENDDDIFENSGCEIAASINIQGIVNPHDDYKKLKNTTTVPPKYRKKYDKNFKLSYHDDISRITDIYTKTLGSNNQIKFFNDEFNALFKKDDGTNLFGFTVEDEEKDQFKKGIENDPRYILLLKFIAMMNMVMGKNRKDGGEEYKNLPECLKPYNGLYIKYLEKCHIISKFTIDGVKDNIYIASHSGIPYKKATETTGFFYIPNDVGEEPKLKPKNNYYIQNIKNINNNFNIFIERIINNTVEYTDDDFKKYVAMGASCMSNTITELTSEASPIVSSSVIGKIRDESLKSLSSLNIGGATKIYNIFGHQPSGFTPQINRVIDSGDSSDSSDSGGLTSYHIDLDVSKAEDAAGISNKKSFVYLTLNNSENNLVGKIDTKAKYFNLKVLEKEPLKKIEKTENTDGIDFEYDIPLDDYCINKVTNETISYGEEKTPPFYKDLPIHMFLVNDNYYGMFGYDLVKLPKRLYDLKGSDEKQEGGRASSASKKKTYTKSAKRFMNGKKQMVIYLGKRGGEYLKVKGEYISLIKYIKIANKKKPIKK